MLTATYALLLTGVVLVVVVLGRRALRAADDTGRTGDRETD